MRMFALVSAALLICACGQETTDVSETADRSFAATVTCTASGVQGVLRYVIGRADYGDRGVVEFATVPTGDGTLTCVGSTLSVPLRPVHLPFGNAIIYLKFMGLQPPASGCPINSNNVELLAPVGFYCMIDSVDESCTVPATSIQSCVVLN